MAVEASLDHLMQAYLADPEGYETNRDLGLKMIGTSALVLPAEKHVLEALSFERAGADREPLLHALATIAQYKGEYDRAIALFTELFNLDPDNLKYLPELGGAYFLDGRMKEVSDVYKIVLGLCHGRARQDAANRRSPVIQLIHPYKVLCSRFGELAEKPDIYVKARILGLTPEVTAVLPAPRGHVANPCLLDYWRRAAAPYVTVVTDAREIAELELTHAESPLFVDYVAVPDGRVMNRLPAYIIIQRLWEEAGRAPLLALTADHRERGRKALAGLGLPGDAWFVALHVREAGFHLEAAPWDHNALRNARTEDYFPAIEAITARGGWVVRVGDPSMIPLPPMPGVIDYVHSEVRSDWMDVFLCGACRFFVGTNSGPNSVASVFGIPVVSTNYFPLGYWPYSSRDIVVHKLIRRRDDGRFLDIAEAARPPLAGMHWPNYFDTHGLEIIDNTPEDIVDAVTEMLDRLDGTLHYSVADEETQRKYVSMVDFADCGMNPRVAAGFLRRNAFLIGHGGT